MYRKIILSNVLEYVKKNKYPYKKSGKMLITACPYCKDDKVTANKIPNTYKIRCLKCKKTFTLIDIAREIHDLKDTSEEDILQHIKEQLKLEVNTQKELDYIGRLLKCYKDNNFDLVPIAKNEKYPIEKDWTNKTHTNPSQWEDWITNNLNIGVKTGNTSKITVIDIDSKKIHNDLKDLLPDNTLIQRTKNGWHYFFKYDEELPKTRIDEYKIDIENDGGQVVVEPSVTGDYKRKFINRNEIKPIPTELRNFLLKKVTIPRKTISEQAVEDIKKEIYRRPLISEGEGRNEFFIRLGGIFRKFLSKQQTEETLKKLDRVICEPSLGEELQNSVFKSIEKYIDTDEEKLQHEILKYLKEVEVATKSDIELAIVGYWTKGENKKRVNRALRYLVNKGKIVKKGKEYQLIKKLEWKDTIMQIGQPVEFKVPYFYDYADFNKGDVIIIGAKTGEGKTHLAMNMIKRIVDQGIKPYYVYNESGGRFGKIALRLGLKEGDFWFPNKPIHHVSELEIPKKAITIYDWIQPTKEDGFARLDLLFQKISEKTEEAQGLTICFVQIRKSGKSFALDLIDQNCAFYTKYLYRNDEGTETQFDVEKVRDGKMQGKRFKIPCIYDFRSKEVKRIDEVKGE